MTPVTTAVTVAPALTTQHDVTMTAAGQPEARGGPVKLEQFVVSTSKEMAASAVAINEQRFASNLKTVVSTDEFGTVAEGHVGEFLKFLPGVTMDYAGGNAREISINGAPADNVPVTLDGFSLATAISGIARASAVDMVSINGISRVEVSFSPTPDTSGAALAGSVNMIPRSAFERSRPVFNGGADVMMCDHRKELQATPVPREDRRSKVYPCFDFSWVVPVNKRFGFTLSGGRTRQFAGQDSVTNTWRGGGTVTNGTPFPHTTPDQPYLSIFAVRGGGKETTRHSLSATLDFKFARNDTLSSRSRLRASRKITSARRSPLMSVAGCLEISRPSRLAAPRPWRSRQRQRRAATAKTRPTCPRFAGGTTDPFGRARLASAFPGPATTAATSNAATSPTPARGARG